MSLNLPCCKVIDDVPIQIGHDHDIKLLWFGHQLHASIINNHGIKLDLWIL